MALDIEKIKAAAMAATSGEDGIARLGNITVMLKLLTPQTVIELIARLEADEADRAEFQRVITAIGNAATGYDFSGGLAEYVKAAFARLEAAEKDAARYRWLRKRIDLKDVSIFKQRKVIDVEEWHENIDNGLDEALKEPA